MRIETIEIIRVRMPLVSPFRTSFGTQTEREMLLLRVRTPDAEGWGECVAMSDPVYSSEYVDAVEDVMRKFLIPALLDGQPLRASDVNPRLHKFKGHRMAKAALEMACLDAELRSREHPAGRRPRLGQ